jgi:hypothetical protein
MSPYPRIRTLVVVTVAQVWVFWGLYLAFWQWGLVA